MDGSSSCLLREFEEYCCRRSNNRLPPCSNAMRGLKFKPLAPSRTGLETASRAIPTCRLLRICDIPETTRARASHQRRLQLHESLPPQMFRGVSCGCGSAATHKPPEIHRYIWKQNEGCKLLLRQPRTSIRLRPARRWLTYHDHRPTLTHYANQISNLEVRPFINFFHGYTGSLCYFKPRMALHPLVNPNLSLTTLTFFSPWRPCITLLPWGPL